MGGETSPHNTQSPSLILPLAELGLDESSASEVRHCGFNLGHVLAGISGRSLGPLGCGHPHLQGGGLAILPQTR